MLIIELNPGHLNPASDSFQSANLLIMWLVYIFNLQFDKKDGKLILLSKLG